MGFLGFFGTFWTILDSLVFGLLIPGTFWSSFRLLGLLGFLWDVWDFLGIYGMFGTFFLFFLFYFLSDFLDFQWTFRIIGISLDFF